MIELPRSCDSDQGRFCGPDLGMQDINPAVTAHTWIVV